MRRLLVILVSLCAAVLPAETETLLVLPFFNLSAKPDLGWIGESLSETLREAALSEGLLVLDRDAQRESYRRLSLRQNGRLAKASVIKVAESLDAAKVIYGEFEFHPVIGSLAGSRGTLRLTARLLDLKKMQPGPEWSEMGPLEDLVLLETRLAGQVLQELAPARALPEGEFGKRRPVVRVDAMESYVRGLQADSGEQKIRYFTRAARLDENFSQPNFQLGLLYWSKKEQRGAAEWFARVKPASPQFHHASFLLGLCRYYLADHAGAEAAFRLVAEAVPLNEVFNNLGAAQLRRNAAEALENFRKALVGDSSDPVYHFNVGYALWKRGEFAAAADSFRAALDRSPEDAQATLMLGHCLKQTRPRPGDARTENLARLKYNYEEMAYRQLKAELEPASKGR